MQWYSKLLASVFAAMCCLFVIRQANASAPNGGYRVVETRSDVVIIEIGTGTTHRTIAGSFGEQFRKSTGYDLKTFEGLEALQALNPETTTPVCWPVGDGPIYKQNPKNVADRLVVWSGCPKADKTLWFIAGLTIKIPLVSMKVETYSARMARYEAFDACEDASCIAKLVKNGKAIAGLTHATKTDVPPAKTDDALAAATAKIAKLEKSLAEAKSAPATIVPTGNGSVPTALYPINLGILMLLSVLGYAALIKPKRDENKELAKANETLQQTIDGLQTDLGAVTTNSVRSLDEANRRREVMIKAHDLVIEGNKRDIASRDAEIRRVNGLREEEVAKHKGAGDAQRQLNQMRLKLEDIARDKQLYGELEDQLDPSQQLLIKIDDERTTLTFEYARAERGLNSETTDPKRRTVLASIKETLGTKLQDLEVQRRATTENSAPLLKKHDVLHERLTGRRNLTTKLYTEAQHDRNDAAADRAAAQTDRVEASRLMEEAFQRESEAQALIADNTSLKADLDARQQALEDAEAAVKESGHTLESTPDSDVAQPLEKTGDYAIVTLPEQKPAPPTLLDKRMRTSEQYVDGVEFSRLLDALESYVNRNRDRWTFLSENVFWKVTQILQALKTEIDARVFVGVSKDVLETKRSSQVREHSALGLLLTTITHFKLKPPTVGGTVPPPFRIPGG